MFLQQDYGMCQLGGPERAMAHGCDHLRHVCHYHHHRVQSQWDQKIPNSHAGFLSTWMGKKWLTAMLWSG